MAVEIKVPEVGESITEVYVGEWHKSEGDRVAVDEDLVEVESEKATFDIPASAAGTLARILKQSGETAEIGEVLAVIETTESHGIEKDVKKSDSEPEQRGDDAAEEESERRENPAQQTRKAAVPEETRRTEERSETQERRPQARQPAGHESRPAPLRRKAKPSRSRATRPRNTDGDQSSRAGEADEPTTPHRDEEVVPMSPIRRRISRRLVEAQQSAALLSTFNEIDMSAVISLRKRFQDRFRDKYDVKLGFMSFFVKAAIDALQQFPQLNAEVRGTDIAYRNYYDIGIAIGSSRGLLVPVLHNADLLSFADIETAIHDFAQRAEENELRVEELRGGTFTISNGGVYGSLLSTPIVNPPQSGVLGLHAIQDRPVVSGGEIVARPMMYVALTYDHRIVDGREAVTFLQRIKEAIEEPARMLIET